MHPLQPARSSGSQPFSQVISRGRERWALPPLLPRPPFPPYQPNSEEQLHVKPSDIATTVLRCFPCLNQSHPAVAKTSCIFHGAPRLQHPLQPPSATNQIMPFLWWVGDQPLTCKWLLTTEPRPLRWLSPFLAPPPTRGSIQQPHWPAPFFHLCGHLTPGLAPGCPWTPRLLTR